MKDLPNSYLEALVALKNLEDENKKLREWKDSVQENINTFLDLLVFESNNRYYASYKYLELLHQFAED